MKTKRQLAKENFLAFSRDPAHDCVNKLTMFVTSIKLMIIGVIFGLAFAVAVLGKRRKGNGMVN